VQLRGKLLLMPIISLPAPGNSEFGTKYGDLAFTVSASSLIILTVLTFVSYLKASLTHSSSSSSSSSISSSSKTPKSKKKTN